MLEFENDIENETELLRWLYFYIEKKSEKGVNKKHINKMIGKIEGLLGISFNDEWELGYGHYNPDDNENKVEDIF